MATVIQGRVPYFDFNTNTVGDIICQQQLLNELDYDDIAVCQW